MSRHLLSVTQGTGTVPLALHLGNFVAHTRFGDIPPKLLERAKLALVETVGVAMGASSAPGPMALQRYVAGFATGESQATILGTSLTAPARFAALANAAASNTHDFDDTYQPSRTHPSGPVACAVLAQAERAGASGRALLAAFIVGSEVTCKISEAMGKLHFERGYHLTGTCGAIGAAAGVANIAGATAERAACAIGIGASQLAGFRQNFGYTAKALHAGWAAEGAIVANELAALGIEPAPDLLEGPAGYFHAGGGDFNEALLRTKLASPWSYLSPGVAVKLYPSGQIAHPAMGALLDLIIAHDLRAKDVKRLRVRTNRALPQNLKFHSPRTGLEAQLSMEFCLAVLLVRRRGGLEDFSDDAANDAAVRDVMARIDYSTYSDEEARNSGYAFLTSFIELDLHDGRQLSVRADAAKGNTGEGVAGDIADKYRSCLAYVKWPRDRIERVLELLLGLENVEDVRNITRLLRN